MPDRSFGSGGWKVSWSGGGLVGCILFILLAAVEGIVITAWELWKGSILEHIISIPEASFAQQEFEQELPVLPCIAMIC